MAEEPEESPDPRSYFSVPSDLDRVYRLDDLPARIPNGYALAACDTKGGMRLVPYTAEKRAAGDKTHAEGLKVKARMEEEQFARWDAGRDERRQQAVEQGDEDAVRLIDAQRRLEAQQVASTRRSAADVLRNVVTISRAPRIRRPGRTREHRPTIRRTSSSSRTSSADPGSDDPPLGRLVTSGGRRGRWGR